MKSEQDGEELDYLSASRDDATGTVYSTEETSHNETNLSDSVDSESSCEEESKDGNDTATDEDNGMMNIMFTGQKVLD